MGAVFSLGLFGRDTSMPILAHEGFRPKDLAL